MIHNLFLEIPKHSKLLYYEFIFFIKVYTLGSPRITTWITVKPGSDRRHNHGKPAQRTQILDFNILPAKRKKGFW